jgi:hypothetical protein
LSTTNTDTVWLWISQISVLKVYFQINCFQKKHCNNSKHLLISVYCSPLELDLDKMFRHAWYFQYISVFSFLLYHNKQRLTLAFSCWKARNTWQLRNFCCISTVIVVVYQVIFLHIVMKVALFYTQNRSESSTFLHEKS